MTTSTDGRTRLLVLNGPNLNLLGTREPHLYGSETLADVEALATVRANKLGYGIEFFQSNHEGVLLDKLHEARGHSAGVILNPGGLTHTSVALRDAITAVQVPTVEVHLTNVHGREAFRGHSYISPVALAVIAGAGVHGYSLAVEILARHLSAQDSRNREPEEALA
ncbi:type II 3-dehydroquinate dehydratase [Sinomonas sp. JGH33]|uniref:3-dehydroquinate dehydratase n=1 Tax=Sinomonas terricola TaxID=3110330 RepID=A0ABU5TBQ5_9MICC|nr:type II 3-dehydroquinate dehydratase [Sinomonas sp. JGH33]MEA5457028.1 type II 3-dehydroquinate dehydratase [Sinomonas sp. JGH33]